MLVAMSPPSKGIQCVDAGQRVFDPPEGMAVVTNWVVDEDRKADQQTPDGHVISKFSGYERVAFDNTEASTDDDHDGRESSPAFPALSHNLRHVSASICRIP
jgi:hypothetical protein